jgi:DNA polymerase-3 subunit gamma/tau
MAYLVLARKYRPQTFTAMMGQEHVVRTLSNALKSGQLAHAFLFTGPRGVGKTTAARLVAKAVNCQKGPTAEPCGECLPCVEISEGRAVDVIEIDAASNNGVDNVRDIVEAVKYQPARDRFKVFVVDEVHMLSTGAFNALLKTLEEPPPHVKFVLATTDVHKVPETILSRCQRFDFRRLTLQQIVDQLRKVTEAEGMRLSDAALALVARAAEGGMRDALSLLDQVRAACGETAGDAEVAQAIGAVDSGSVGRIVRGLVERDGGALLTELAALYERGQEMKRVAEEIVRFLRNLVVVKLVPATSLDLTDTERAEVTSLAEAADPAQITRLFDLCQRAVTEVKLAEQPRYALEVALLKGCYLAPGAQVGELIARLEELTGGAPPSSSGDPGPSPRPRTAAPAQPSAPAGGSASHALSAVRAAAAEAAAKSAPATAPASPAPARSAAPARASAPAVVPAPAAPEPAPALPPRPVSPVSDPDGPGPSSGGNAEGRWAAVVAELEKESTIAATAMKQGALLGIRDGEVAVQFPPGATYLLALERKRADVEAVFARFFGRPTKLVLSTGNAPPAGGAAGNAAVGSLAQMEHAEREARSERVRDEARSHPNILEAIRILDGEIDDIEEL